MASNRDKLDSLVSRVAIVFNGFSRTVVNADGSIDAQVTLQLRKRESAADLLYNVEEFIKDEKIWQQMPEKTFINSGIVYERTNAEAQAYKKKHKRRTALGESIGRGLPKLILLTMAVDLLFLRQHFQLIGMYWSLSRDLVLKNLMNYFLEFIGTLEGDIQAENE